jgi:hypothetical protein
MPPDITPEYLLSRGFKTIEGIVECAWVKKYGDDYKNTHIDLKERDGSVKGYMILDIPARIDAGEKVRIYTDGNPVGESGFIDVRALEVMGANNKVKFSIYQCPPMDEEYKAWARGMQKISEKKTRE